MSTHFPLSRLYQHLLSSLSWILWQPWGIQRLTRKRDPAPSGLWSSHFPCVLFKAFSETSPWCMAHAWQSHWAEWSWDVTQHHRSPIISLCHSLTLSSSFMVHGEKCLSLDWSPCWRQEPECMCVWCVLSTQSQVSDGWRSLSHVMLHSKTPGHSAMWLDP